MTLPIRQGTEIKDNPFLGFLEDSAAFYGGVTKDYTCPARAQGVRNTTPAGNPSAVGAAVLGGSPGNGFECAQSGQQLFNDKLGNTSHPGINTSYSNPGVITFPIGVRVYPLKGHLEGLPEQLRKKQSPTAHLPKGVLSHHRRQQGKAVRYDMPLAA